MQNFERYSYVLRNALMCGIIKLSKRVKYEYEPLKAIRGIEREDNDMKQLSESDFYSQEEKRYYGMKLPRGVEYTMSTEVGQYSCSFYKSVDDLANVLHLPKKGWKLAIGFLNASYGSIQHRETKPHIHLFRYDGMVPEFEIVNYIKEEGKTEVKK